MNILFIGAKSGNSYLAYKTLKLINKKVDLINTDEILTNLEKKIYYFLYPQLYIKKINKFYQIKIIKKYDKVFFYNCEYITEKIIDFFKKNKIKTIFYCADNPFLKRDKKRWNLVKEIINKFDLVIFQQKNREKYIKQYKIKNFVTILPPYFKKNHYKKSKKSIKDIVFVGTWFKERGIFFYKLLKLGLKVDIYGNRWDKDKHYYKYLKKNINLKFYKAHQVRDIINNYKIALALYSKENDDDISNRSIEIPASGGLICSENSKILKKKLIENKEAIYFNNVNDCVSKCKTLLKNTKKIFLLKKNSQKKILSLDVEAFKVFKYILNYNPSKKVYKKFVIGHS